MLCIKPIVNVTKEFRLVSWQW